MLSRRPVASCPMGPPLTIDKLVVADPPEPWRAAGFEVDGDTCVTGSVRVLLEGAGRGRGIVGWSVRGASTFELDGLPTTASETPPPAAALEHPNGVIAIDHVVVFTPDLDRTTAALRVAGLDLRRVREEPTPGGAPRQSFFRMGDVILEVVQAPEGTRIAEDASGPARLWGISFLVEDLERTASALGDLLGKPREAVQPDRRIATLRKEAGLGPAIAFMTPGPGAITA
jgi:catechol 2,3-dioxygenase-like lactoylglutathione lyase family enzyme